MTLVDDDQPGLPHHGPANSGLHGDHLHGLERVARHAGHDEAVLDAGLFKASGGVVEDLAEVSEEPDIVAAIDGGLDDLGSGVGLAETGRCTEQRSAIARTVSSANIIDCFDLSRTQHGS